MKSLIQIFVAAQLDKWNSYDEFETKLRAHPKLRKRIGMKNHQRFSAEPQDHSTSYGSGAKSLSDAVAQLKEKIEKRKIPKGIAKDIGEIHILDSTARLPPFQIIHFIEKV